MKASPKSTRVVTCEAAGALLAVLVCVGCASHHEHLSPQELLKANIEAMQEAVPAKVSDPARARQVSRAIDELRGQLLSFGAIESKFQANIVALNARPDATRAEFDTLVDQFDKQRIGFRTRVLDLHSEMIAATTAEEWEELAPYERRLLTETEER